MTIGSCCEVQENSCLKSVTYLNKVRSSLSTPSFLARVLDGGKWLTSSGRLVCGGMPGYPLYRRLVCSRHDLDTLEKGEISCLCRQSNHDLSVVQPPAQSPVVPTAVELGVSQVHY
jgi:hypothetical protein